MGEMYDLSVNELKLYFERVLSYQKEYEQTKSFTVLQMFLVVLYEFMEMFAVNGKNEQAKLGRAKSFYVDFDIDFIRSLFAVRGRIVHKNYLIVENDIIDFYQINTDVIQNLEQFFKNRIESQESTLREVDSFN